MLNRVSPALGTCGRLSSDRGRILSSVLICSIKKNPNDNMSVICYECYLWFVFFNSPSHFLALEIYFRGSESVFLFVDRHLG